MNPNKNEINNDPPLDTPPNVTPLLHSRTSATDYSVLFASIEDSSNVNEEKNLGARTRGVKRNFTRVHAAGEH